MCQVGGNIGVSKKLSEIKADISPTNERGISHPPSWGMHYAPLLTLVQLLFTSLLQEEEKKRLLISSQLSRKKYNCNINHSRLF